MSVFVFFSHIDKSNNSKGKCVMIANLAAQVKPKP